MDQQKDNLLGSLWDRSPNQDGSFLAGVININGQDIQIKVSFNKRPKSEKSPQFLIFTNDSQNESKGGSSPNRSSNYSRGGGYSKDRGGSNYSKGGYNKGGGSNYSKGGYSKGGQSRGNYGSGGNERQPSPAPQNNGRQVAPNEFDDGSLD